MSTTGQTNASSKSALVAIVLVIATFAAFWRVGECKFVNLDDDAYVEFQPMVNHGLRPAGIVWAFTASHSSNWHPLTTLSHLLDCELFGLRPAPMHWENVLWHALDAVLVFLGWRALTGALWRSAIVAAFFALHPLRVESVAWISERKDVLSTFFWLLGILAYVRFTRQRTARNYALVAGALVLALLSKPMAVTFPFTLLLLDFWPLSRWPAQSWRALLREKWPLFAIVAAHSLITFFVQRSAGAANYGQRFSLGTRLENAVVSYARYLGKAFWPDSLSPHYFHPGHWPLAIVLAALALLTALSLLAWRRRRAHPWLACGWLWFLGTLVPVIGLVQVGSQSMADRYSYVPLLGVLTALVWLAGEWANRSKGLRTAFGATAVAGLLACGVLTFRQVCAWKDSLHLYRHSIAAGEDNSTIRYLLGAALLAEQHEEEAAAQFRRALELQPDYVNALTQLASLAMRHKRFDDARRMIEASIQFEPRNPGLRFNLAMLALWQGRTEEAVRHLQKTLELDPASTAARHTLAQFAVKANRPDEARAHYAEIVRLNRWDAGTLAEYGVLLANLGNLEESRRQLARAAWIDPDNQATQKNLQAVEQLLQQRGRG